MKKVTTINLNGKAYQLEEDAYGALRAYLDDAALKLSRNPDKDEILRDLEQAVGEKASRFLNPNKNIITEEDARIILEEMGPVDDPSGERGDKNAYSFASGGSFKKLYRIREGAIIKGVCAGIAAYFNADPTLVRILFIALSLMSGGGALIAYILMAVFIPYANTPEERSAASSQPFNAHELIARAKAGYYSFKNKK